MRRTTNGAANPTTASNSIREGRELMCRFLFLGSAIVIIIGLTGCVSETTVFHSPDGQHTGVCSGAGFGIIRGTMAIAELNNCKDAYRRAGYIPGPAPIGAQPVTPPPLPSPVR